MRSSQPLSTSARQHRAVLYHKSSKRRSFAGLPGSRYLTLAIAALVGFVLLGAFVSLKLHPHPREGDIVVDDVSSIGSGRKDLRDTDGGEPAESELYSLLEALVDTDGRKLHRRDVRGRVLLIANVASQCGYTASNYELFRDLLGKYYTDGLRVLAVPCGDFGHQEFDEDDAIRRFVRERYDQPTAPITLLRKMDDDIGQNALFTWLRSNSGGLSGGSSPVSWNFNKWLIDRRGQVRQRYDSNDHRQDLERDISLLL